MSFGDIASYAALFFLVFWSLHNTIAYCRRNIIQIKFETGLLWDMMYNYAYNLFYGRNEELYDKNGGEK